MLSVIIFVLIVSCGLSTTNGLTIREAPEGGSIGEVINTFTDLASDTNFTNVQPDSGNSNKTESVVEYDPEESVTNASEDPIEDEEEEEDKMDPKPSAVEETIKPVPSSSSTPTASTTNTTITNTTTTATTTATPTATPTTTSASVNSSSVTPVDKPIVTSMNLTNPIVDSFVNNDTLANEYLFSLESIMTEMNATSESDNNLDGSSNSVPSDEFANYFELLDKLHALEALFADQ